MKQLTQKKELIQKRLEQIKPHDIEWSRDVIKRLKEFASNGKMLRGSLFLTAYELFGGKEDVLDIAVALELTHSTLCIHDDVMDRDERRRNFKTIHKQYQEGLDNEHYGYAMAINAGDIGFFLAFKYIPKELKHIYTEELIKCAYGQMQDVHFSFSSRELNINQILEVYKYKTARYTFSLPLMLAAKLTGKNPDIYGEIGENLGIIFQIIDDDIGLFGDQKQIGKDVGSDIKENKKTLHRYYLLKNKPELKKYFGKKLDQEELQLIQKEAKLIKPQIKNHLEKYTKKIQKSIEKIPEKEFFEEFCQYNLSRLK